MDHFIKAALWGFDSCRRIVSVANVIRNKSGWARNNEIAAAAGLEVQYETVKFTEVEPGKAVDQVNFSCHCTPFQESPSCMAL